MNDEYIRPLPEKIKEMVSDIERLIGSEIQVRSRTDEDLALMSDPTVAQLDCCMKDGVTTATIALPLEHNRSHFIIHEILHAHRKLVGREPYIEATINDNNTMQIASRIDNDLEHLFVIPTEISYAPEAKEYWHEYYNNNVSKLRHFIKTTTFNGNELLALRDPLLRSWVVTSLVLPEWEGKVDLESLLKTHNWTGDAEAFAKKINLVITNKQRCISAFIRFCRLNPARYGIAQFCVSEGKINRLEIPAH